MSKAQIATMDNVEFVKLFEKSGLSYRAFGKQHGMTVGEVAGKLKRGKARMGKNSGIRIEQQNSNEKAITYSGNRITTVEQLLEYCEVDLNEWAVEKSIINKWEVGIKAVNRDLEFDHGKVTGEVHEHGEISVSPLIQVKIWLVRKHPLRVYTPVQPLSISFPKLESRKFTQSKTRYGIVLPDPHFGFERDNNNNLRPFHDRSALDVALQIVGTIADLVGFVVWNGDVLDLAEWSDKFYRSPSFTQTTQPALIEAAWWLNAFKQAAPNATHVYLEGNHEVRMLQAVGTNLTAAYGLRPPMLPDVPAISVRGLLGLDSMGIEYIDGYPDNSFTLFNNVEVIHGDIAKGNGMATSNSILDKVRENVVYGHIHRNELVSATVRSKDGSYKTIQSMCPGCLCRIDGAVPGSSRNSNWQQGFGIVCYNQGIASLQSVVINEGRASFGEWFAQSTDRTAEIQSVSKYNFGG